MKYIWELNDPFHGRNVVKDGKVSVMCLDEKARNGLSWTLHPHAKKPMTDQELVDLLNQQAFTPF